MAGYYKDKAAVQQAMAAFEHQLNQERDKGLADGAAMFLQRFEQVHGVSPVAAVNNLHAAAEQVQLGLQWGEAAWEYIGKREALWTLADGATVKDAYSAGYEAGAQAAKEDHDCGANEELKDFRIIVREWLDNEPDPSDAYDFVCKLDALL